MSDEKTISSTDAKKVNLVDKYNDLTQKKIPWAKVKMLPFGMDTLIKEIVEFVGHVVMRVRDLEKALEKQQGGSETPPEAKE